MLIILVDNNKSIDLIIINQLIFIINYCNLNKKNSIKFIFFIFFRDEINIRKILSSYTIYFFYQVITIFINSFY